MENCAGAWEANQLEQPENSFSCIRSSPPPSFIHTFLTCQHYCNENRPTAFQAPLLPFIPSSTELFPISHVTISFFRKPPTDPPLSPANVLNLWNILSHHKTGNVMMETQSTPSSQDVHLHVIGPKCNLLLYIAVGVNCRIFKLQ